MKLLKFGHIDHQFSPVPRGLPQGSGEHPKTVVYNSQKKIKCTSVSKHSKGYLRSYSKLGRQGPRIKQKWNKKAAKLARKAHTRK